MAFVPSGRQVELRHGDQVVTVVEVGGGLRAYTVDGTDVLDGYDAGEMASAGRGQLLLPWPNRLAGGRYQVDGATAQAALDEPELGNAIHGLTRWAAWEVADAGRSEAHLRHRLLPQPGYPFALDLSAGYRLDDRGLTVTLSATNVSDRPCPFGAGAHPYLKLGPGPVDGWVLTVPATTALTADDQGIPTGRRAVAGTALDFRHPRPIGATRLDTCYTDLSPDGAGRILVEVADPDQGRRLGLWSGEECRYLMVFTGDTVAPERRRRGLAVEPMTCAPNAFQSGEGLRWLAPGETATLNWGIEPGR